MRIYIGPHEPNWQARFFRFAMGFGHIADGLLRIATLGKMGSTVTIDMTAYLAKSRHGIPLRRRKVKL